MGLFKQSITVFSADGAKSREVEAWVDTGSTYTWLPADVMHALGFEAEEEREFILANGERERRHVAQARISLGGPRFFTYCAFAREGEELLLGAVALEEAGLAVDPVNRRLVPAAGYALTAIADTDGRALSRLPMKREEGLPEGRIPKSVGENPKPGSPNHR